MDNTGLDAMVASFKEKHDAALEKLQRNVKASNYDRAVISDETDAMIMTLLTEAREIYAEFGTTLSPEERARKIGARVKNIGYIETCYLIAQNNPQFLPSQLPLVTFTSIVEDFRHKRAIDMLNKQFGQETSDGLLESSNTAYHAAGYFYQSLKTAAMQKIPGAEAAWLLLSGYFKKNKHATPSSEPNIKQTERDVHALLHGTKDGKIIIENESPKIVGGKRKIIDNIHKARLDAKETLNIEETE